MTSRRQDVAISEPQDAAGWVARLASDQRTRADEEAFEAWLADDPTHAAAYAEHAELWAGLGALGANDEARSVLIGEEPLARPRPHVSRRAAIGAFGSAIAASLAVIALPPVQELRGVYRTRKGEQRQLILDDGSRLMLDTDTRIRVRYSDAERRLTLDRGRAYFKVAKDAARPFRVFVGADEVRALGTAFDVRKDRTGVKVTLEEGVVAVYRESSPREEGVRMPSAVLRPGQQARIAGPQAVRVAAVDLEREQAWRYGRLVLDEAGLAEAVADLNRYGG
ncbi:MAG TPA: FecR domain-containing protein, partial [Caulobacteraceae bacterium]|nr:FecR domain-containing protein [Caulobacteraceae bacterium]